VKNRIEKYFEINKNYLVPGNSQHRVFKLVVKE